ncbi:MAG: hypothetical protein EOM73_09430 [Bacteroidia bacterium]|nr:hypothetical protein [Bacteroidia bacterium]
MYKNRGSILILFCLLAVPGLLAAQKKVLGPVKQNTANQTLTKADNTIHWLEANLRITDSFCLTDTVQRTDDELFAYGTNIRLPKLIHGSGEFEKLNLKIAADFDSIINQAIINPKPDKKEYHKVFYNYFKHDSIISLKITNLHACHLSEATTVFMVYHFDFKNNRLLNTTEIFEALGLSRVPVLNAFAEQCTLPPDFSEPLFSSEWFERVKWNNFNLLKFYMNQKKQIVIIYPAIENGIEDEQILE